MFRYNLCIIVTSSDGQRIVVCIKKHCYQKMQKKIWKSVSIKYMDNNENHIH